MAKQFTTLSHYSLILYFFGLTCACTTSTQKPREVEQYIVEHTDEAQAQIAEQNKLLAARPKLPELKVITDKEEYPLGVPVKVTITNVADYPVYYQVYEPRVAEKKVKDAWMPVDIQYFIMNSPLPPPMKVFTAQSYSYVWDGIMAPGFYQAPLTPGTYRIVVRYWTKVTKPYISPKINAYSTSITYFDEDVPVYPQSVAYSEEFVIRDVAEKTSAK